MHLKLFLFRLVKFSIESVFVSFHEPKGLKPPDSPDLNQFGHLWAGGFGSNRTDTRAHLKGVRWSPHIKQHIAILACLQHVILER